MNIKVAAFTVSEKSSNTYIRVPYETSCLLVAYLNTHPLLVICVASAECSGLPFIDA